MTNIDEKVLNNEVIEDITTVQPENKIDEPEVSTENDTKVDEVVNEPKSYTEDDIKKLLQSTSSKAKNEILQSLGVKSIDEFKAIKTTLENARIENERILADKVALEKQVLYKTYNIPEDRQEDFDILYNSKLQKNPEADKAEIAKSITDTYFVAHNVGFGTEKQTKKEPAMTEAEAWLAKQAAAKNRYV